MTSKVNAWVVIRLEGEAIQLGDYVSIKGVYDSQEAADKAAAAAAPGYARNVVVLTRRFAEDGQIPTQREHRVQGLPTRSLETQKWFPPWESLKHHLQTRSTYDRSRASLPILGYLAEAMVA